MGRDPINKHVCVYVCSLCGGVKSETRAMMSGRVDDDDDRLVFLGVGNIYYDVLRIDF